MNLIQVLSMRLFGPLMKSTCLIISFRAIARECGIMAQRPQERNPAGT
jgi:hypothetical protein